MSSGIIFVDLFWQAIYFWYESQCFISHGSQSLLFKSANFSGWRRGQFCLNRPHRAPESRSEEEVSVPQVLASAGRIRTVTLEEVQHIRIRDQFTSQDRQSEQTSWIISSVRLLACSSSSSTKGHKSPVSTMKQERQDFTFLGHSTKIHTAGTHRSCWRPPRRKTTYELTMDDAIHLSRTHIDTGAAQIHLMVTVLFSSQLQKATCEWRCWHHCWHGNTLADAQSLEPRTSYPDEWTLRHFG